MTKDRDTVDQHDEIAARLYDGNAAVPLPATGEFYSYSPAQSVIDRRSAELWGTTAMNTTERDQLRRTFRTIQATTKLPDGLVAKIADAHIDGLLADVRAGVDNAADELAVSDRQTRWGGEVRDVLGRAYGPAEGERILQRTAKFVRAHPTLAGILRQRGLGSRPDIVEAIAAHVFSTGYK